MVGSFDGLTTSIGYLVNPSDPYSLPFYPSWFLPPARAFRAAVLEARGMDPKLTVGERLLWRQKKRIATTTSTARRANSAGAGAIFVTDADTNASATKRNNGNNNSSSSSSSSDDGSSDDGNISSISQQSQWEQLSQYEQQLKLQSQLQLRVLVTDRRAAPGGSSKAKTRNVGNLEEVVRYVEAHSDGRFNLTMLDFGPVSEYQPAM